MIQRFEQNDSPSMTARLEAVLFAATESLSQRRLCEILEAEAADVKKALHALSECYAGADRGIELVQIAGGWRILTQPECADVVRALAGNKSQERLSRAALETLSIVAYKQPVSRAEVERIRGVGVGPVLRSLIDLDLVKVSGREEGLGRALLYSTTREFLDRFGLNTPKDLPASLDL